VNGALRYLLVRTTVNAWRVRLARLRNPRYAAAAVVGLAYFAFILRRPASSSASPGPEFFGAVAALGPFLLLAYVGWTWLAGGSRTALVFDRAEVSLLFPAPLARRGLVLYKLAKEQIPVFLSAVIFGMIGSGAGDDRPLRIGALFLAFSTINLHRLAAALVHAGATEAGGAGRRRAAVPIAVFATIVVAVAWSLGAAWPGIEAAGVPGVFRALGDALGTAPAAYVLLPFGAVFAPLGAQTTGDWVSGMAFLGAIAGLHLGWVLRLDASFEEAAAIESERMAQRLEALRQRKAMPAITASKTPRRSLPLDPTGPAWVAITWKNLLHLVRSGGARGLFAPAALVLVMPLLLSDSDLLAAVVLSSAGALAASLIALAPSTMRNDLRADLAHLAQLKTYPIAGWQLVLAEVGGSAIPVTLAQCALGLAAVASLQGTRLSVEAPWLVAGCLGLPVLLGGLTTTSFLVHNALALLFPGWSRQGAAPPAGIEAMGTGILALAAVALAMLLACLAPAAAAVGTFFALEATDVLALPARLAVSAVVAGALLLLECWAMSLGLGQTFEALEPQDAR